MLVPFRKYAVGYDWMIPGGFAAMVQNTAYMKEALSKPEKFNETLMFCR